MPQRHFHRRARPFRYGGLWWLGGAWLWLLPGGSPGGRTAAQLIVGPLTCLVWPWLVDWARSGLLAGPDRDRACFVTECLLLGGVFAWCSLPLSVGFAFALCLLAGATALAGWPLAAPAAAGLAGGAALGWGLAPRQVLESTRGADAMALLLLLGFMLALGQQSFRQACRLHGRGRRLAQQSASLERVNSRLQRYLPRSLAERIARAPEQPWRWERCWLTVVFVDLVGFTELAERLEAELLAAILDEYLGALMPAAERHAGEVSKLLGDGVLLVFGLGDAVDRRQAARAALAFAGQVAELLAALAARWHARGEPLRLSTRVGIASGFCTLGDRGGDERLDFTLIGSPVNLASRLQGHAPVDGVLLDQATAALLHGDRPLVGPRLLRVKGRGAIPVFAPAGDNPQRRAAGR